MFIQNKIYEKIYPTGFDGAHAARASDRLAADNTPPLASTGKLNNLSFPSWDLHKCYEIITLNSISASSLYEIARDITFIPSGFLAWAATLLISSVIRA